MSSEPVQPEIQAALDALAAMRLRPSTLVVYRRIIDAFAASHLPLAEWWLEWSDRKSSSTLAVARAALVHGGLWDPVLDAAHQGAMRAAWGDPAQAPPMLIADFATFARYLRERDPLFWRLVVLGWWGGLRVSEIVALRSSDIEIDPINPAAVRVRIESSKTSDRATFVVLPERPSMPSACPMQVFRDLWQCLPDERLFPHHIRTFARRFRVHVNRAWNLRLLSRGDFSTHSLRAGIATELDGAGVGPGQIARHCRWRSMQQVLTYVRDRSESPLLKVRV